jgi:hypothetical protein
MRAIKIILAAIAHIDAQATEPWTTSIIAQVAAEMKQINDFPREMKWTADSPSPPLRKPFFFLS